MTRTNRSAVIFLGILAAVFLVAGLAVSLDGGTPKGRPVALGDVRLISMSSCDELVDWYQSVATGIDAPVLGGYGPMMFDTGGVAVREEAMASVAGDGAAPASGAGVGGDQTQRYSDTNVQERGVDEPDTVKTNGDVVLVASSDKVAIVDVSGGEPELIATMPLEQGSTEILLSGDRVLALTTTWRQDPSAEEPSSGADQRMMMMPVQGEKVTVLTSLDISDPAHPRVLGTREVEGTYRTARATGTTARVVIVSSPRLPSPGPAVYESQDQRIVEQRLEEWKREAIASMTVEDWAPSASGDCASVTRTSSPEGLGSTSIFTFDLQGSLDQLDSDTIVADAGTVYASTDRLFIATSRWSETARPSGQVATELHSFDISDPAQTTYIASGDVSGYLLNQWSLSEKDGHLRVATTDEAPWDAQSQTQATQSGITVLDEQGQELVVVGRVDGLGVTERIQAVRYIGDTAYVVTFRQTDPLYAIDLSDPTAPRVAGELKIPGYSAYLHPIDDDRLIGVGQDATDEGRTLGSQIGTFDVSDPTAPSRIDALRIDGGSSVVEYDPRAFLWWDATRTVVMPVEIYEVATLGRGAEGCPPNADCIAPSEPAQQPFLGAIAFGIDGDGAIVERGRVTHAGRGLQPDGYFPITRSVIVGDALYTISDSGVLRSNLGSLSDEGFARFPAPQYSDQPIAIEG